MWCGGGGARAEGRGEEGGGGGACHLLMGVVQGLGQTLQTGGSVAATIAERCASEQVGTANMQLLRLTEITNSSCAPLQS